MTKIFHRSLVLIAISCVSLGCSEQPLPVVVDGVNFVGASVSNLDRSTDLYSQAADLSLAQELVLDDEEMLESIAGREIQARGNLLKSVNAQLLLMQFSEPSAAAQSSKPVAVYGPGIAHVCYQVNSKTKTYQKFLQGGATHIGEQEMVQLNPKNPVHYAYAHDIDKLIFEVEHVDVDKLDLPEPPKNDYRIRHVSLATPDMNRIVGFYSKLLSQPKPRRAGKWLKLSGEKLDKISGQADSKIQMAWFQTRNLELEIIEYTSHAFDKNVMPRPIDAHGYNMIVFDVTNLAAARERFTVAGGTLLGETSTLLGAPTAFGRDPDGNLIGLQETQAEQRFSAKNFPNNGI